MEIITRPDSLESVSTGRAGTVAIVLKEGGEQVQEMPRVLRVTRGVKGCWLEEQGSRFEFESAKCRGKVTVGRRGSCFT